LSSGILNVASHVPLAYLKKSSPGFTDASALARSMPNSPIAAFAGAAAGAAGSLGEHAASKAAAEAARRSFIRMENTSGDGLRRHSRRSERFVPEPERVSMKFIE
jgi:hypothetical protein